MPGLHNRRFFPKTTVPAATEAHPTNFKTLDSTFSWASVFLMRIANKYSTKFVCKKLRNWRWRLTTCFSGVGCAEMVPSLYFISSCIDGCCEPSNKPCFASQLLQLHNYCFEASLSLESAAFRFLKKHDNKASGSVFKRPMVKLAWSCEINTKCREVLHKTFNMRDPKHCLFGDILKTGRPDGKAYCLAHEKFCLMHGPDDSDRFLTI